MNTDKPARWFRLYAEFATDPKVQMMSEAYQRRYLMVLCLRCGNGSVTLQDTEVAFQLRITESEWLDTKRDFMLRGLVDDDNNVSAWDKRQYVSDSSAERVAAYRARQKQRSNVTVTTPETETETETENKKQKQFDALRHLVSLGVVEQVARDWIKQRKTKPTLTAIKGIEKEASKSRLSLHQALEISCSRGWQSFKAEWIQDKTNTLTPNQSAWLTITGQTANFGDDNHGRTIEADPLPPALLG